MRKRREEEEKSYEWGLSKYDFRHVISILIPKH